MWLPRREDADLDFVEVTSLLGPPALLDTFVYIDGLEGSFPPEVETLPGGPDLDALIRRPRRVVAQFRIIDETPLHRLDDAISLGVILEGDLLSGLVFRHGGFQPGQEVAALNHATIYLHALEHGYTGPTRNIREFDSMSQIVPPSRVLFYRT